MSNKESVREVGKPSRLLLDVVFWVGHVSIALYLIYELGDSQSLEALSYARYPSYLCFALYPFVIGSFANRIGRNGFWWGLLSFLFSPLGVWITYISSYRKAPVKHA